jgi:predicted nucleic acid-binding protein
LQAGAELAIDPRREKEAIQRVCGALWVRYLDEKLSEIYGYLFLIAASALSDEAPLVTRNVNHFLRVPGLAVLSY